MSFFDNILRSRNITWKHDIHLWSLRLNNDEFYGDVVEYDIVKCKETIIANVYHRVNTAQRETFDRCFRDILEDKIIADDYVIIKNNLYIF